MLNASDPETQSSVRAAMRAFNQGDHATAQQLARRVLARAGTHPVAHQILGVAALEAGEFAAARLHLEAAAASAPGQAQPMSLLGAARRGLGDAAGARAAFARAGELGLTAAWRDVGALEAVAGDVEACLAAFRRAGERDDAAGHAQLAHAFERRHDLARAKAHAEAALALDPGNAIARVALARALLREKDHAGAEAAASPVTQSAHASRNDQAVAWGVIGEARDLRGDARAAFTAFATANGLLREQHAAFLSASHLLPHPDGVARMTALAAGADVSTWRWPVTHETPAPAFLVGFPRSGTTLLDQILSSHSRIACVEEKEHFASAVAPITGDPEKLARYAELGAAEIEAARDAYWRRVRAEEAPPEGALVVDKLPLNIILLPLVKRVFPEAKVIFALRDPRDVILSCYQQRFGANAAMAQLLELDSAAAYYDAVMSLFELCRARLALDIHQVRYEDVVADLEAAARGLAAFLGLPFEPGMLDFRDTALRRDIKTPSMRQVTQPLYSRSIGRWRRYAEQLAPVLPTLDRWAARYGYETAAAP